MPPLVYDYIVTIRVTPKAGPVEEYRQPVQAYSIQDALVAALVELDAEHGVMASGADVRAVSVRPDVGKIGEQTRSMLEELGRSLGGFGGKPRKDTP
jgi:hypothetical protein